MTVRTRPDEERVWLQAMIASLGGLASINVVMPTPDSGRGALHDWEKVNAELARDAAQMADRAIEEWRQRYPDFDALANDEESGL